MRWRRRLRRCSRPVLRCSCRRMRRRTSSGTRSMSRRDARSRRCMCGRSRTRWGCS
ncbi:hypothetical protein ACFPRL_04665 [Pseudoclavibacter helvolus]